MTIWWREGFHSDELHGFVGKVLWITVFHCQLRGYLGWSMYRNVWITPGMILEVLSGSRLGTTHDCYEHLWRCLCSTLIQAIGICKWPRLLCCIWKGGTPVRISTGWFRSPMFHDIVVMMMKQLQLVQPSIYIIYNIIYIYIAKLTYHLIMYWVQGNEMTTSLGGHHKLLSLGMMVFLL
jgi:hypothetical protein